MIIQSLPHHLLLISLYAVSSLTATELSIITQNIMTESNNSCDDLRLKKMGTELNQHKAMIIIFQEVVTPSQKKCLKELFPTYTFEFSDCKKVTYDSWKSYQPTLIFVFLGGSLFIASILLYAKSLVGKTEFYTLLSFSILLVTLGTVTYPTLFLPISGKFSPISQLMANHKADHMGVTIAFAKKYFLSIKRCKAKPFDELAYQFPSWKTLLTTRYGILNWWRTWIQVTWIRPGYLYCIVKHQQGYIIGVLNMHLATGLNNTQRIKQVEEILSQVAHDKTSVDFFLLCGDMNANPDQSSVKFLRQQGWVDLYLQSSNKDKGYTWDVSNYYVNASFAPSSERVDYIWAKLIGIKLSKVKTLLIGKEKPYSDHFGLKATIEIQKG